MTPIIAFVIIIGAILLVFVALAQGRYDDGEKR